MTGVLRVLLNQCAMAIGAPASVKGNFWRGYGDDSSPQNLHSVNQVIAYDVTIKKKKNLD